MNICITNYDLKPEYLGGIKRVSSILADEWIRMGHNVDFMSFAPKEHRYDNIISRAEQFFLPNTEKMLAEENVKYFSDFISKHKIDVLLHQHSESTEMNELCFSVKRNADVKLITTCHFSPTHIVDITDSIFFNKYKCAENPKQIIYDLIGWLRWKLYRRKKNIAHIAQQFRMLNDNADGLCLLSEPYIPVVKKMLDSNSPTLYAINNPIYLSNDNIQDDCSKEKLVLWCGRVEFGQKRVDRMLDIWKIVGRKYQDWKLVVMGSGNIPYFENLVKKNNIPNVVFTGHTNPSDYYRKGSILCMTSSTEGWGMVLIEAQMRGCVPIAYNSYVSATEIITDGENGFLIPKYDKQAFINRLELLMNDDETKEKMARNAKESVTRFGVEKIAKDWIKLFESVI